MSDKPINLNGMKVSQKLDVFRYTESDFEKVKHIWKAADEARELESQLEIAQNMQAATMQNAAALVIENDKLKAGVEALIEATRDLINYEHDDVAEYAKIAGKAIAALEKPE